MSKKGADVSKNYPRHPRCVEEKALKRDLSTLIPLLKQVFEIKRERGCRSGSAVLGWEDVNSL
jgi:hypothetical protein